jgi:hypothetical protein
MAMQFAGFALSHLAFAACFAALSVALGRRLAALVCPEVDWTPFDAARLEPSYRLEYRDDEAVVLALARSPLDLHTSGVSGGPQP